MIRVLIADDHEIVRKGLRMTIEGEEDLLLLGEARTGREALEMVRQNPPDVLLLDLQMPEMDGVEAARCIRADFPDLPILALTSFTDDAHLHAALRAGMSGYLLKDMSGEQLCQAIRGAAAGAVQLHPEIARRLVEWLPGPPDPFASLTPRELEALQLLAEGKSNKEIGAALHLTEVTVKGYVSAILAKLGVQDRTQAALMAVKFGL